MTARKSKRLSGCPIDYALEIFGDRWSLLIVRDLMMRGKRYFRDLMASEEGIASNILARRLKKLERWGLIVRRPDPANRRQIVYDLTEKGLDLAPIVAEIAIWSVKYDAQTAATKGFVARAKRDRDALAKDAAAAFRQRRFLG